MADLFGPPTITIRPPLDALAQLVSPLSDGERRVVQALATLDAGWSIYIKPRVGLDCPDILAMHDTHGVCVIEVVDWDPARARRNDDGDIELCDAAGVWTTAIEPRFAASRSRLTVFDQFYALPEHGGSPTAAIRGVVIVAGFSTADARALLPALSDDDPQSQIRVFGDDTVATSIREIAIGHAGEVAHPESIPPAPSMSKLRRHIVASEQVTVPPEKAAWLSEGVQEVANNPRNLKILGIRGAAGSGKSFALTARAARLAAEGKSVLLLSLNVTLANRLRAMVNERCREIGANPTLVACSNFHSFCTRVVQDAEISGLQLTAPRGSSWVLGIVAKTEDAFEQGFEVKYDAILIDEGQDFTLEWWALLYNRVLTPGGEMMAAADPTQDIYDRFDWTTAQVVLKSDDADWSDLGTSYRLPHDLLALTNTFAATYLEGEMMRGSQPGEEIAVPGGPAGSVRNWLNIDRPAQLGRAVGHEVVRLLRESPTLRPGDISFVCDYHHDGVAAVRVIEQAGYPVHHIFSRDPDAPRRRRKHRFWPDADAVKGCTAHSLKGWETSALVTGIGVDDRAQRLAYVAMTRVVFRSQGGPSFISIVNADNRLADFGRQFVTGNPPVPDGFPVAETVVSTPVPAPVETVAVPIPPPPPAPVAPVATPVAPVATPVAAPIATPVAPVATPVTAPVATPVAPVATPVTAPVATPPPAPMSEPLPEVVEIAPMVDDIVSTAPEVAAPAPSAPPVAPLATPVLATPLLATPEPILVAPSALTVPEAAPTVVPDPTTALY